MRRKMDEMLKAMHSGYVVSVKHEEVVDMINHIFANEEIDRVLSDDFMESTVNRFSENEVVAMCMYRAMGMRIISLIIKTPYEEEPQPFEDFDKETDDGAYVFTYALNIDCDWCSEFGGIYLDYHEDTELFSVTYPRW